VYGNRRNRCTETPEYSTGSYFTKPFAVEHLLDHALEPALDDHVARLRAHLDAGDDAAAAGAFFDFRCADIAMGSGHFLVAAVDRIEARLSGFLALNPIPAVTIELDRLRSAAYEALGELADGVEIETTSLLRRQVGRRCIYGVDRNETAVELARLAIWIHTFVPGLPLSFLNHNLVVGDSLTGIGTIDEALVALG
jgi:type II restriction/modification system DNA methylase subunit YeeA